MGQTVSFFYLITNRCLSSVDKVSFQSEQALEIAKKLVVAPSSELDQWLDGVARFGRSFGCNEQQIERGIDQLVGQVMSSTKFLTASMERTDLIKALVGYEYAKPIQRDHLPGRLLSDLRRVGDELWPSGIPVRRKQWDKISQAIFSEGPAFLLLVGDGGSGKTTALVDWLLQQLKRISPYGP